MSSQTSSPLSAAAAEPMLEAREAEQIGAIGLFLAAPTSRYVTGQMIVTDGDSTVVSALNPG